MTIHNPIVLKEHDLIEGEAKELLCRLEIKFVETPINTAPKYLGIKPSLEASYFIGADWLDIEKEISVVILPKMEQIDYIKMFMCSLQFDIASDYFSKIYSIDFDKKEIKHNSLKDQLTPLLVIHYLSILKRIIKRGLKKDYVLREENLNSKIKGRVLVSKNIRSNEITKRYDRTYCRFQEYIIDNPENRLLKKALLFAQRFSYQLKDHSSYKTIHSLINNLLSHFIDVSDEIEINQIRSISSNKIYKEYIDAIRLAKMILRRFSYSLLKVDNSKESTPAFWIDMSRLYEVYVYSLLHEAYGNNIQFQVEGYRQTAVDFIKTDEQLIIDTKYKPRYNDGNSGMVDDIRQISSYARDEKILKRLLEKNNNIEIVPTCLIIYPENNNNQDDPDKVITGFEGVDLINDAVLIKAYRKFYKISVPLPKSSSFATRS
jgi:5-methylcytosine-specific restriction enzyme subunit McrC